MKARNYSKLEIKVITTVKVVVKKQKVFMTCSGMVGAPPVMHLICSPMYCLSIKTCG